MLELIPLPMFLDRARLFLVLIALPVVLVAAAGLDGCSGARPLRPTGSLGDSINSPGDEFAPSLRPDQAALYFTSNRNRSDDIYRSGATNPTASSPGFLAAMVDRSDLSRLSQPSTNDGTIAFTGAGSGFFASGHAPDTLYGYNPDGFGGIVGGTDLFEFAPRDSGGVTVRNLGRQINSIFWDAHPTAGVQGDTTVLIFSSDRPGSTGYGSPYRNTFVLTPDGDTIQGNADLYFVFRAGSTWGPVVNFVDAIGGDEINTPTNEYSPYLFCVNGHPRLFFSSNREGSFDIYEAELDIDYGAAEISVNTIAKLPSGQDNINTDDDELFPYLSDYPVDGKGGQYLFFSSNRETEKRKVGDNSIQSAGGFDLYRFPLTRECRPPRLRYQVVVLDAEQPSRPVKEPIVRIHRLDARGEQSPTEPETAPMSSSRSNPASFPVEFGAEYAVFGGSTLRNINCDGPDAAIESYRARVIAPGRPDVHRHTEIRTYDTLVGARRVFRLDTMLIDTMSMEQAANVPPSILEASQRYGDSLIVVRRIRWEAVKYEGGEMRTVRGPVAIYDTTPRWDTLYIPTTERLAPSERVARFGNLNLPISDEDVIIRDTIWVHPRYYDAPDCQWLYSRNIADEYEKNVPYFQTTFWEVNTSTNLREHRSELSSAKWSDAGFIELHPRNQYFGTQAGSKRNRRLQEYADFATIVDRNLSRMASEIMEQIVPEFLEYDEKTPGSNNRLVIQILAFSDIRPIQRGYYLGGPKIEYLGGTYDASSGAMRLYDVAVSPGASLVSASNDTLSKLRVFYGYRELLKRLERYPLWKKLVDDGTIVLPWPDVTENQYRSRMEKGRILVIMEGRNIDATVDPTVKDYGERKNDYYELDNIRRVDVLINRLEYINGRLVKSPCCR